MIGNMLSVNIQPAKDSKRKASITIKHDIYSLGVCILEILLWPSLIIRSDLRNEDWPKATSDLFQRRAIELGDMPERYFGDSRKMTSKPTVVRKIIMDLCRTELPACAGNKLAKVVMDCLCCLDGGTDAGQAAKR